MRGSTTLRCRANPLWLRRQHSNLNGLAKLHAAAGAAGDGEVLIRFKPSEVEVIEGFIEDDTTLLLLLHAWP